MNTDWYKRTCQENIKVTHAWSKLSRCFAPADPFPHHLFLNTKIIYGSEELLLLSKCIAVLFQVVSPLRIWHLRRPCLQWMRSLKPSEALRKLGQTWNSLILCITQEAIPNRQVAMSFIISVLLGFYYRAFEWTWLILCSAVQPVQLSLNQIRLIQVHLGRDRNWVRLMTDLAIWMSGFRKRNPKQCVSKMFHNSRI